MKTIKSIIFLIFVIGASIRINAQISIAGFNCVSNVSPSLLLFDSSGGTSTITATQSGICHSWNITSNESWITVSPGSVTKILGNVEIQVTCAANNTASSRTATINVGGYRVEVNQIGKLETPTIVSVINNCGNSVLKRGTPPEGVTWYWQGTSCDTSTTNSNLNYTVTSSGTYYLRALSSDGRWSTCASKNITITKLNLPNNIEGAGQYCNSAENIEIRISGIDNTATYSLLLNNNIVDSKPGNEEPLTFVVNEEGTYKIKLEKSSCINELDDQIEISKDIFLPIVNSHPIDVKMCENAPIQEVSFSVDADGADLSYQWQSKPNFGINYVDIDNANNSIYSFIPPHWVEEHGIDMYLKTFQNIRCIVNNQCGQVISEIGNLIISGRPSISLTATPDVINEGENSQLVVDGGTYYKWLPSTSFSTNNNLTVSPENTTTYTVVATNDEICYTQRSTKVKVELTVSLEFKNGNLIATVKGGDLNYYYSWTGPSGEALGNSVLININKNGEYNVEVSDGDNQSASASIIISYFGNHNLNYVKTITVMQPGLSKQDLTTENSSISYNYVDGLGRTIQNILVKASPKKKDVIQQVDYDKYGRGSKKYLPYSVDGDGGYRNIEMIENEYAAFFDPIFSDDTEALFAETKFDNSPLNRPVEQGAPGADWQLGDEVPGEHTVKFVYGTNAAGLVNKWIIKNNGMVATDYETDGTYDANTLYVNTTTDENQHNSKEYKNLLGQIVLTEDAKGGQTYYIYDDFGLLRCVVPPLANGTVDDKLCYFYRYDHRKRMIEKKIPGADPILMVYDSRDRLVLTQDGNMRQDTAWMATLYDNLNRPKITGIYIDNTSSDNLATSLENIDFLEGKTIDTLSQTFYDSYDDLETDAGVGYTYIAPGKDGFEANENTAVKGQITYTKTKVPETGQWLVTVNYYDDKYRVIQTIADNHLGGRDVVSNRYDFVGKVDETIQEHYLAGSTEADNTIAKLFHYDHTGRLDTVEMKIDDETDYKVIATNSYNELGQLETKASNDLVAGTNLVNTSYSYNIRGWMTNMDNKDSQDGPLFNLDLFYNNHPGDLKQYNGNISRLDWKSKNQTGTNYYDFTYDNINRLKLAKYNGADDGNYSTTYGYDLNGNIESLTRRGFVAEDDYHVIDDLHYKYAGNQLAAVNDINNPIAQEHGFTDNGLFADLENLDDTTKHEYFYDPNGNLVADYNKGIEAVHYNHLNLPTMVDLGNNNHIEYIYDAAGIKLQQRVYKNGDLQKEMDYVGNFVYENGSLAFIITDEGRLVPKEGENGGYEYEYFIKDHLGNTRVTVKDNSGTAQIVQESHYYPFGMTMEGLSYSGLLSGVEANKYLYNGKELQDDLGLNWYDYGARFYDAQIGRFHVVDNYAEKYTSLNPYQYVANNPINSIDFNGDYIIMYDEHGTKFWYENGKAYWTEKKDGKIVRGKEFKEYKGNAAIKQTVSDLNKISETTYGHFMVNDLVKSKIETGITFDSKMTVWKNELGFDYEYSKGIKYNVFPNIYLDKGVYADKSHQVLGHEIAHAWADQFAPAYTLWEPNERNIGMSGQTINKGTIRMKAEKFAVGFTNYLRACDGETNMRKVYSGNDLGFGFSGADYFRNNPWPSDVMKNNARRISKPNLIPKKLRPIGTK
jgi:RHS repeat-associated protein